ncbi:MAG: hypothetical protein IV100_01495 [Myxococcales bacterium]|nr:hypothetical protein [Myxococcales bacterium]
MRSAATRPARAFPLEEAPILRRIAIAVLVLAALGVGAFYGYRAWYRAQPSGDVAAHLPADLDTLVFLPNLEQAVTTTLHFARGISETGRFRDLFKAETGADIGTADGLRSVGFDPEGAVAVVRHQRVSTLIAGAEAPDRLLPAMVSKLQNLGFARVETAPLEASGLQLITAGDESGAVEVAVAIHEGLLALSFPSVGADAVAAAKAFVSAPAAAPFFDSAVGRALVAQLPGDGPIWYGAAARTLKTDDGKARYDVAKLLGLPDVIADGVNAYVGRWIETVEFAGARMNVEPCATAVLAALGTKDSVPLIPAAYRPKTQAPDFGRVLPRDTVAVVRAAVDVGAIAEPFIALATMGASLGSLVGGGDDPIVTFLGKQVSPELADRHVVNDVLAHVSGHFAVALLGVDRKAPLPDLGDLSDPLRWLSQVQLVLGIGLADGKRFLDLWWPKRAVLASFGFESEEVAAKNPEARVLKLSRNCRPPPPPPKGQKPPPPKLCERYGVYATPSALHLTSGHQALDRLLAVEGGKANDLRSLTREPLGISVLEHGPETVGLYFSFDGLLKAVSGRNLPGGATRYLAQAFEFVSTLDAQGGDAVLRLLLTR